MKVILDAIEQQIKTILLQYSSEFTKRGNPELTLRFTGGWVRDKLLNRKSHDIDVAIDQTTGEEFAAGLQTFLKEKGLEGGNVHKIAVNPEKSKHLETATTRICGLDIDFVNLRSEEYASDSRVPTKVSFGTPLQDAFRRDATLNALFYNLSTNEVEDFTGQGLADLNQKLLRTPLDPFETFNDDPLRVLRLLRFVGQLGFDIEENTFKSMHGSVIGQQIKTKISHERIGTEILKLVEGVYALKALNLLISLDLGSYVFTVPNTEIAASKKDLEMRLLNIVQLVDSKSTLVPKDSHLLGVLYLSSLLQDVKEFDQVMQSGLHLTKQFKENSKKLIMSSQMFDELFAKFKLGTVERVDLGLFVRHVGELWPLALAFNAARDPSSVEKVELLEESIKSNGLERAYLLKPMVGGKDLMQALQRKAGPWMQRALAWEMEYMLANPNADKEDVLRAVCEHTNEHANEVSV